MSATTTTQGPTIRVRVAHDRTAAGGWRVKETTVELEWVNRLDPLEEFVVPGIGGGEDGEATDEPFGEALASLMIQADSIAHAEAWRRNRRDRPEEAPR